MKHLQPTQTQIPRTRQELLQALPKVDTLLNALLAISETKDISKATLLRLINHELSTLRAQILALPDDNAQSNISESSLFQSIQNYIESLPHTLTLKAKKAAAPTLSRVINATGVVIQTNLGRSVLSPQILESIAPYLCSYHTLEYDLEAGKRGERYSHCAQILCELFESEDALLVNNNAASVLLILSTFARDKEVIISRGELVEIGGSFRIPEVMKNAGAILHEVGATNKTHLRDYTQAINNQSAMIMKAHRSNFRQIGFVGECDYKELIAISKQHGLIDYFDLGSGHAGVLDHGAEEPSVQEIMKLKPSLLSFSGDKLLGGPQVGIILGKRDLIERLKQNQLLRALRVDKFSILALLETLKAYQAKEYHKIPTLSMLLTSSDELQSRAKSFATRLERFSAHLSIEVLALSSLAGGGSLPEVGFSSYGVGLTPLHITPKQLESAMRQRGLIASLQKDKVLLDMRTLLTHKDSALFESLGATRTDSEMWSDDYDQIIEILDSIFSESRGGSK